MIKPQMRRRALDCALHRSGRAVLPHSRSVHVRNHLPGSGLNTLLLRQILGRLLGDLLADGQFELDVHYLGAAEIIRLNEAFLRHRGPTDVIAFDYSEPGTSALRGEIFVCLSEAVSQARRFHTSWQRELVRYVVHGVLHLCGYSDRTSAARRKMKRAEDALLRKLANQFDFAKLGPPHSSKLCSP